MEIFLPCAPEPEDPGLLEELQAAVVARARAAVAATSSARLRGVGEMVLDMVVSSLAAMCAPLQLRSRVRRRIWSM
jgi:hypothetical protein